MTDERDRKAPLSVFEIGPDHVVAADIDDAWDVWCAHRGEKRGEYEGEMARVADDAVIRIFVDAKGRITDESDKVKSLKLTAAEWAAREGRGFLCSTEM